MTTRTLFFLLALTLAGLLAGCSSSDPTSPTDENDPGVEPNFPHIPTLAEYGNVDSMPATSDTVVTGIEPWLGPFTPAITDMFSAYSYSHAWSLLGFGDVTLFGGTYENWASALPVVVSFTPPLGDDLALESDPFRNGPLRFVLADDGETLDSPYPASPFISTIPEVGGFSYSWTTEARSWGTFFWTTDTFPLEIRIPTDYVPTISEAPFLKRELYWKLSNINGSDYKILQPGYTFSEQTSYTTGVSESESYEFFWSLTTEVSGGYGPVSASVSASVGETFGTSLEVYEETTVTITESLEAPGDQAIMASRWQLMERYTFCRADGSPLNQGGLVWTETPLLVPGENRIFIEDYEGQ